METALLPLHSKDSCNMACLCCRWCGRQTCHVGPSRKKVVTALGSKIGPEYPAGLWCRRSFCCHFGRWNRSDVGPLGNLQSQRSAEERPAGGNSAFAAILADGSVVTWGKPNYGGDSSRVQNQLRNVQQISATDSAFAAILAGGSVVTRGDRAYGGDSSGVQDRLRNVQHISAGDSAFAAILADGGLVTWGNPHYGWW